MVDQQVARQRRNPCLEAALLGIEAVQIAVDLEEDVLGQVLGVAGRVGEAVADGVDTAVLAGNKLMPGVLLARNALADEFKCGFLLCDLLWTALQRRLYLLERWKQCIVRGGGPRRRIAPRGLGVTCL